MAHASEIDLTRGVAVVADACRGLGECDALALAERGATGFVDKGGLTVARYGSVAATMRLVVRRARVASAGMA